LVIETSVLWVSIDIRPDVFDRLESLTSNVFAALNISERVGKNARISGMVIVALLSAIQGSVGRATARDKRGKHD
jgi:hypothetical protein